MQKIIKNKTTAQEIEETSKRLGPFYDDIRNKTFFISGTTGLIGSLIVRTLLHINEKNNLNLKIIAHGRDSQKLNSFYKNEIKSKKIEIIISDIVQKIKCKEKIDYIIHCAGNTSSKSFVEYPIETMDTIIGGTKNILEFACQKNIESMVYLSSMEVYGQTDINQTRISEQDLGQMDILNPRSSYPMGKRAAETMCAAYYHQKNTPVKIARLAQIVSPAADYNDNRVFAQFARSIVQKRDIILNTPAETVRSFSGASDAIVAIFTLLIKGKNGEAYNVANEEAIIAVRDLAKRLVDNHPGISLKFEIDENAPYPPPSNWSLDTTKIKELGFEPMVSLDEMFSRLIDSFYKQKMGSAKKIKKISNLEKVFSIRNEDKNKIVILLGKKIKIDKNYFNKFWIKYAKNTIGIQKNKIVFSNYMGRAYGCNPKYVADELIKRNAPFDYVWLLKPEEYYLADEIPSKIRIVDYTSKQALMELATAKYWVDNYHKIYFLKKGLKKDKSQIYIQMWHGSLGIKKLEKNVSSLVCDKDWENAAELNSKITDVWVSNSDFETRVYNEAFWKINEIKLFGHPRNDIFFRDTKEIKNKVFSKLNIDCSKKIVLYAPTFREDYSLEAYNVDFARVKSALEKKFGGEFVFVVRFHPRVKRYSKVMFPQYDYIVDATFYPDIQELLAVSDVLLSDYSSCMFDYMLTKNPVFVYAVDIEKYDNERGFYYSMKDTPFPIAEHNDELINQIENFDYEKYKKEVKTFLDGKGCIDDGHASERVVDFIIEHSD